MRDVLRGDWTRSGWRTRAAPNPSDAEHDGKRRNDHNSLVGRKCLPTRLSLSPHHVPPRPLRRTPPPGRCPRPCCPRALHAQRRVQGTCRVHRRVGSFSALLTWWSVCSTSPSTTTRRLSSAPSLSSTLPPALPFPSSRLITRGEYPSLHAAGDVVSRRLPGPSRHRLACPGRRRRRTVEPLIVHASAHRIRRFAFPIHTSSKVSRNASVCFHTHDPLSPRRRRDHSILLARCALTTSLCTILRLPPC